MAFPPRMRWSPSCIFVISESNSPISFCDICTRCNCCAMLKKFFAVSNLIIHGKSLRKYARLSPCVLSNVDLLKYLSNNAFAVSDILSYVSLDISQVVVVPSCVLTLLFNVSSNDSHSSPSKRKAFLCVPSGVYFLLDVSINQLNIIKIVHALQAKLIFCF